MESQSVKLDAGGVDVIAEVDRPGDEPEARLLLAHGAGGNRSSAGLRVLAAGLAAEGVLVVRPDLPYRAAGRSSPPLAEKTVPGFVAIVDSARRLLGGERWTVGGRSYGGRVASMAVAGGLDAAGLLLWSYPLHRPGDPSHPRVAHWPQITVPTLFLEGTRDPFCDPETFSRHLPELGVEPKVHFVEGGDHSLKVAKVNAPDGKARSEGAVVAGLVPVIREWMKRF